MRFVDFANCVALVFPLSLFVAGCGDSSGNRAAGQQSSDAEPPPPKIEQPASTAQPSNNDAPQTRNVFGPDNRVEVTTDKYPWCAVGKLVECGCTGTLIGRDLVLTAAHCVMDPETKQLVQFPMAFYPNYRRGQSATRSPVNYVWWGTNDPDDPSQRTHDWAILRLDEPLGDTYGWLGTNYADLDSFPDSIMVVGYSGDFLDGISAAADWTGRLRGKDEEHGLVFHDCDATRGSSGGPVLALNTEGKLAIFGLNVAERRLGGDVSLQVSEYADAYANVALPSMRFLPTILDIKNAGSSSSNSDSGSRQVAVIDLYAGTEAHVPTQVLPVPKSPPPVQASPHAGQSAYPGGAQDAP